MNENLSRASDRFIEGIIGHLANTVGVSRVIGQLYALLFLSDKPLSLNDMVEKLKISKGNASLNIRELEKLGVVKKVWVRGDRKDFYEAELNFSKIMKSGVTEVVKSRMKIALAAINETENLIKEIRSNLNEGEKKTAELYLQRLQNAKEIYRFAEKILDESIFKSHKV